MSRGIICRHPVRGDIFVERLSVEEKVSFIDSLTGFTVSVAQGRRVPPCTVTTQQL